MIWSPSPEPGEPPVAVQTGADLRAARERLGRSVEEMAAALRLRASYLAALEEGRLDALPGHAYALYYLRSYASALGLDPESTAQRFKAEVGDVKRRPELRFPAPVPQRDLPGGAVILIGLVLAVGAYGGWYYLSGEGKLPPETVAPVPERLTPLAERATSVPPARRQSESTPSASPATSGQEATEAPASAEPEAPVPAVSPSSAAAALVTPPGASRIVLEATADAWLQVRGRNGGGILLNRTLHNGETWPVPAQPDLVLTTGNAGGTELVVDGTPIEVPGGSGAVRRDLPLDPDLIKEGGLTSLPAATSRPAAH